jgi:hypothetical protein
MNVLSARGHERPFPSSARYGDGRHFSRMPSSDSPSDNTLETQMDPDRRVIFGSGVPVTISGGYSREARKILGRHG